jgi:hypothetical protein
LKRSEVRPVARRWRMRVGWEPRDLWRGVYWNVEHFPGGLGARLHVYVCVLPMVVVHYERAIRHDIGPWGWLLLADGDLCRRIRRTTPWHFWLRGRFYRWSASSGSERA